jgi:hypothetical protein
MPCKTFFNTGKSAGQNVYQPTVRDVDGNLRSSIKGDFELPDIEEIRAEVVKRERAETMSLVEPKGEKKSPKRKSV